MILSPNFSSNNGITRFTTNFYQSRLDSFPIMREVLTFGELYDNINMVLPQFEDVPRYFITKCIYDFWQYSNILYTYRNVMQWKSEFLSLVRSVIFDKMQLLITYIFDIKPYMFKGWEQTRIKNITGDINRDLNNNVNINKNEDKNSLTNSNNDLNSTQNKTINDNYDKNKTLNETELVDTDYISNTTNVKEQNWKQEQENIKKEEQEKIQERVENDESKTNFESENNILSEDENKNRLYDTPQNGTVSDGANDSFITNITTDIANSKNDTNFNSENINNRENNINDNIKNDLNATINDNIKNDLQHKIENDITDLTLLDRLKNNRENENSIRDINDNLTLNTNTVDRIVYNHDLKNEENQYKNENENIQNIQDEYENTQHREYNIHDRINQSMLMYQNLQILQYIIESLSKMFITTGIDVNYT